jgi:hypothetical protein
LHWCLRHRARHADPHARGKRYTGTFLVKQKLKRGGHGHGVGLGGEVYGSDSLPGRLTLMRYSFYKYYLVCRSKKHLFA